MKSNNTSQLSLDEKLDKITELLHNSFKSFNEMYYSQNNIDKNRSNSENISSILEKLHSMEQIHSNDKNNIQGSVDEIKSTLKEITQNLNDRLNNKQKSLAELHENYHEISSDIHQQDKKNEAFDRKISNLDNNMANLNLQYQEVKGEINQLKMMHNNLNGLIQLKDKSKINFLNNFLYPIIIVILGSIIGFMFNLI